MQRFTISSLQSWVIMPRVSFHFLGRLKTVGVILLTLRCSVLGLKDNCHDFLDMYCLIFECEETELALILVIFIPVIQNCWECWLPEKSDEN